MSPFVSYACDRWGRRPSITIGSVTAIIGAVLQGAAQAYPMFVVARFLIGMGICLASAASPLLITECAYPSQRGKMHLLSSPLGMLDPFLL